MTLNDQTKDTAVRVNDSCFIVTKYLNNEDEWIKFYHKSRPELWNMFNFNMNCPVLFEISGRFSRVIGVLHGTNSILNTLDFCVWNSNDAVALRDGKLSIQISPVDGMMSFIAT